MLRIPYARELAAIVALAAVSWAGVKAYGWAYGNGYDAANARAEAVIAEFMAAERKAAAAARRAELDAADAFAAAATEYERGRTDAQAAADRTIADLRAGNVRLREHWQGCTATSRVSGDATAAALADARAQLRAAGAGDLVRLADQCDAQVTGLQALVHQVTK